MSQENVKQESNNINDNVQNTAEDELLSEFGKEEDLMKEFGIEEDQTQLKQDQQDLTGFARCFPEWDLEPPKK